ncbi:ankyrin repeat and LEM domain-containing protein 1 [Spodoptera frugiperda]|uniref:Ankyrin repeat and LEM domain-containing protein 1 n=1 Tax=Spodoptera frugiperda TaxID=7108 RepID=A0A9R0EI40_SPOFR|nr:ankyrin repeat and LEM domain-containing protein 1 [Spodoptera frugiperda]
MGTAYKELFKLYDIIQNGTERSLESFLKETPVQINQIIPCKGIGLLHLAVGIEPEEKSKKCTELLLKHGGDPNLCNDDGVTPVHIAAIWGRVENLKLLIGCGGDPGQRDLDGHSAFDYATREEQWEVFDYLHNVVDLTDDAPGHKCAYTLDLERVLLTTDQVVAEYGPIIDENQQENAPAVRKSELINEWCERNSLAINKLYPTIISETYLIDNESAPWKSTCLNFSDNVTLDLTKDRISDTNTSFKSCISNKLSDVISGVHRLEMTPDETRQSSEANSNVMNQRISVYENFSLPGSPNNITHKNYNTKTSLKKQRNKNLNTNTSSLISNECSQELDNVLAVVQNKTNEWLCTSKGDVAGNTRRSSASSGVSTYSGGSIVLANVQEEYKYEDREEDVVLIEKRLLVSPVILPLDGDLEPITPDHTIVSVASSLPASVQYDDNTLRAELLRLGFTPGPIQDTTRNLYLKKLQALKKNPRDDVEELCENLQGLSVNNNNIGQKKSYSIEISKSLRNADWMNDLSSYVDLENKARTDFSDSNKKWREGTAKTSFTYLLLDPRLTDNLPAKSSKQDKHTSWVTFVNSIFYVGKGKRSRPYSHLYQALTLWKKDFKTSKDKKVQHILDIWSDKVGVVCLHVFQNVIPAEAYTNEAAMIDALGVNSLKNLKVGNYYGVAASWPMKERRMLGQYLLYKAMLIFLSEGERQLRPDDLD